jgi:hypothetical protein
LSTGNSEARFTINVKEGIVELEGKESFVDKHLEKFEEIFKMAVKEAIANGMQQNMAFKAQPAQVALPAAVQEIPNGHIVGVNSSPGTSSISGKIVAAPKVSSSAANKHNSRVPQSIPPIPVDLKANDAKPGLREFYAEKKPQNHYEKTAVFAYYLTKFNKQQEVRYGEILSCYEEVNEKKPSVFDIVKNSIRYKGWLEQGSDKFSTRLSISGENYVKFDMPSKDQQQQLAG